MNSITIDDIYQAQCRIHPYIRHTPLEKNAALSTTHCAVYLKLENLQVAGSFKPRGAFNKILSIKETHPKAEFVAPTAGGHGVGFSYAASVLQATAHIYLPHTADPDRMRYIKRNGARIHTHNSIAEARLAALEFAQMHNHEFVSAYNDRHMIEGGGTIGLEILQDCPNVETVIVGVGGGGLIAGLGIALKEHNPKIRLIGVQPENNAVLSHWFSANTPVNVKIKSSIAEGIGGNIEKDVTTWPYIQRYVDDFILISEDEIKQAMYWMVTEEKHLIEPSGVAGLAALLKAKAHAWGTTVIVVTGRNVSWGRFNTLVNS